MFQKDIVYFNEIGEIRNVSLKYIDFWDTFCIFYVHISFKQFLMYYAIISYIIYIHIYCIYTGCVTKIQTNRTISLNEILLTKKLSITKNSFTYYVVGLYKV